MRGVKRVCAPALGTASRLVAARFFSTQKKKQKSKQCSRNAPALVTRVGLLPERTTGNLGTSALNNVGYKYLGVEAAGAVALRRGEVPLGEKTKQWVRGARKFPARHAGDPGEGGAGGVSRAPRTRWTGQSPQGPAVPRIERVPGRLSFSQSE